MKDQVHVTFWSETYLKLTRLQIINIDVWYKYPLHFYHVCIPLARHDLLHPRHTFFLSFFDRNLVMSWLGRFFYIESAFYAVFSASFFLLRTTHDVFTFSRLAALSLFVFLQKNHLFFFGAPSYDSVMEISSFF